MGHAYHVANVRVCMCVHVCLHVFPPRDIVTVRWYHSGVIE